MSRRRRQRRYNGCRGKARFGSQAEALAEQPGQFAYSCTACGCWHLTSHVPPWAKAVGA